MCLSVTDRTWMKSIGFPSTIQNFVEQCRESERTTCDSRLPPGSMRELPSSGSLRSQYW